MLMSLFFCIANLMTIQLLLIRYILFWSGDSRKGEMYERGKRLFLV